MSPFFTLYNSVHSVSIIPAYYSQHPFGEAREPGAAEHNISLSAHNPNPVHALRGRKKDKNKDKPFYVWIVFIVNLPLSKLVMDYVYYIYRSVMFSS